MKRLHKILLAVTVAVTTFVLLLSCGDAKIIQPPEQPESLRYRNEAEQMALVIQGTLRPSEWLTKQINDELVLIRDTWGDSIPTAMQDFETAWIASEVDIRVDTALYIQVIAGSNSEWNDITSQLKIRVMDRAYSFYPRLLYTESDENLHPVRVAQYFVGFPGVQYVQTAEVGRAWFDGLARKVAGDTVKYYFRHILCLATSFRYAYFNVIGDTAIFRGTYDECWSGDLEWLFENYPGNDYLAFLENWEDSAYANRPEWVDEARHEISNIDGPNNLFHWQRP